MPETGIPSESAPTVPPAPPASPPAETETRRREIYGAAYAKAQEEFERTAAEREQKARDGVLADLGFHSPEEIETFKASRQAEQAKRPEAERRLRELERRVKESEKALADKDGALAAKDGALAEWSERWFGAYAGNLAATLARQANLHDSAREDLADLLDRCIVTDGDGDDTRLLFRRGDFEVELPAEFAADDAALKKLVEYVVKSRGHWVRPTVAAAAGVVAGRPSGTAPPANARDAFIGDTVRALQLVRKGG